MITGSGTLQVSTFIPPPILVGDYNDDGTVDAADYTVWRKNVGQSSLPNRDPMNVGAVGQADFNSWRIHFGQSAGTGSHASIPEPAATVYAILLVAIILGRRR